MRPEENVKSTVISAGGAVCDRINTITDSDLSAKGEGARAGYGDALNGRAAIGGEACCLGAAAQGAGAVGGDDGVSEHSGGLSVDAFLSYNYNLISRTIYVRR